MFPSFDVVIHGLAHSLVVYLHCRARRVLAHRAKSRDEEDPYHGRWDAILQIHLPQSELGD